MALGEAMAANDALARVHNGCLMSLGWTTNKPTEIHYVADVKNKYDSGPPPKAYSEGSNGIAGVAVGRPTIDEAIRDAMQECRDKGGKATTLS